MTSSGVVIPQDVMQASSETKEEKIRKATERVMQRLMGGQQAVDAAEALEQQQQAQLAAQQSVMMASMNAEREAKEAAIQEQTLAMLQQAEARMQAMKDAAVNGGGGGGGGGGGDDSEVTKLKEQLVRAEEQNEQMATKIRLVKEGKVKDVDTVEVRWL